MFEIVMRKSGLKIVKFYKNRNGWHLYVDSDEKLHLQHLICISTVCLYNPPYEAVSEPQYNGQNNLIEKTNCAMDFLYYSKTCVKQPLSKRLQIGFQDQSLLNAGQKYCRMLQGEHSAILLTFIKPPFVIFVLSIFEWPFYIYYTV